MNKNCNIRSRGHRKNWSRSCDRLLSPAIVLSLPDGVAGPCFRAQIKRHQRKERVASLALAHTEKILKI